jgi:hypothetical protein
MAQVKRYNVYGPAEECATGDLCCYEEVAPYIKEAQSASANTGSPKLCRSCIKLYACVKAGDNIMGCCEYELIAA